MKKCECDLRTKLVGDGCEVCSPQQTIEYLKESVSELTKERDELVEALREAVDFIEYAPVKEETQELLSRYPQ